MFIPIHLLFMIHPVYPVSLIKKIGEDSNRDK